MNWQIDWQVLIISIFGSGGIGWIFARLAIKDLIRTELQNYVECKYCNMQHDNLTGMMKSINKKLDILIKKELE
ncbi:MAG: hypothetical protein PHV37_08975 [Candidatus Gastranaerophilales bacterium]|nr:hypothetical protein [Candidatus Gastranaerophilales bacterium]